MQKNPFAWERTHDWWICVGSCTTMCYHQWFNDDFIFGMVQVYLKRNSSHDSNLCVVFPMATPRLQPCPCCIWRCSTSLPPFQRPPIWPQQPQHPEFAQRNSFRQINACLLAYEKLSQGNLERTRVTIEPSRLKHWTVQNGSRFSWGWLVGEKRWKNDMTTSPENMQGPNSKGGSFSEFTMDFITGPCSNHLGFKHHPLEGAGVTLCAFIPILGLYAKMMKSLPLRITVNFIQQVVQTDRSTNKLFWIKPIWKSRAKISKKGQITATSHNLIPIAEEEKFPKIPFFQGNLGWWNIISILYLYLYLYIYIFCFCFGQCPKTCGASVFLFFWILSATGNYRNFQRWLGFGLFSGANLIFCFMGF